MDGSLAALTSIAGSGATEVGVTGDGTREPQRVVALMTLPCRDKSGYGTRSGELLEVKIDSEKAGAWSRSCSPCLGKVSEGEWVFRWEEKGRRS